MRKILIVGGTFDNEEGKRSGLVSKFIQVLTNMAVPQTVTFQNGGRYEDLEELLELSRDYDIVFWWPNVSEDLPMVRDVKQAAPNVMLISSVRNDNAEHEFDELVSDALHLKAALTFEFKKVECPGLTRIGMRLFDPAGRTLYEGDDPYSALNRALARIDFLKHVDHTF